MHLLSVCPFPLGDSTNAFVIANLRSDGYDVPGIEAVIVVLTNELMLLDPQENALLEVLDERQMKPKYNKIVWTKLQYHMQAITPRLTVSLSDLTMDPKPVDFGLQMGTSRDETYPTAGQRAIFHLPSLVRDLPSTASPDLDAVMNDNFDLSCTSVPITANNYKDFMHSPPQTPIRLLDLKADPEIPSNFPGWMWPRAPLFGQPHIDAFTGLKMETIHRPVFGSSGFNGWEDEEEMPLLAEFIIDGGYEEQSTSSSSMVTDKAFSKVGGVLRKRTEDVELPPLSPWSLQRFSFSRLGSGSDTSSEASLPESFSPDSTLSTESETLS